jgi:hypothetical protein
VWRWRLGGAAAALALWLLALVHFRDWVAHNDFAILRLDLERQLDGHVRLVGAYSRLGAYHPGPLHEWAMLGPYWASGRRAAALPATALVLEALWAVWIVVTARRAPTRAATLALLGGLLALVVAIGPNLASPWNPHLAILPTYLAATAAVLVWIGERRAWLAAVVGSSFAAQAHASALLAGAVVLGVVAVVLAGDATRERRTVGDRPEPRPAARRLASAAVVAVAAWSGPLVDLRRLDDANLVRLLTDGADGARVGLGDALGHVSRLLWPPAVLGGDAIRPTADLMAGWSRLLVLGVLLTALVLVATQGRAWAIAAIAALVVAVASVSAFVEPPFPYLYGAVQALGVFAVAALAVALAAASSSAASALVPARAVEHSVGRLAQSALLVAVAVPFVLVPADDHESADRRALGVEDAVDAALADHPDWDVVAVVGVDMRAAIVEAEVADVAYRRGLTVRSDRPGLGLPPIEGGEPLLAAAMGPARDCLVAAAAERSPGVSVVVEGVIPAVAAPVVVAAIAPGASAVAACGLRRG